MPRTRSAAFPALARALAKIPAELRSAAIRVGLAVAIAAALTCLAIVALWGPFDTRTDVVGYPAFAAFNVDNYLHAYYLTVGFFPLATLAIFAALTRLAPRLGLASPPNRGPIRPADSAPATGSPLVAEPEAEQLGESRQRAVRAARTGFVGAVLGLEIGVAIDSTWIGLPIGIVAYFLLAVALATGLGRWRLRHWPLEARLGAVNSLAAPLAVAGLLAVSASTGVQVKDGGQTVGYNWLPVWIALPLAGALLAALVAGLRRAGGSAGVPRVERAALILIVAPVALFVLTAVLQGNALGVYGDNPSVDLFHSGEQLAASRLVGDGWLPWRDLVLTHGLLSDGFAPLVGHAAFEDSRWGAIAGLTVLLRPIYLISVYFLCVYLFGRNWLFLLLVVLLAAATSLGPELRLLSGENFRFIAWPLILLALAATLDRPSPARSVGLAFLSLGQAIVTPEALPALLAVGLVLAAYEWYWRRPGMPPAAAYRRSIWFAGAVLAIATAFAIFLAAEGALGDFLYVSAALVQGHALKGGIPPATFELPDPQFYFVALAPVIALLISIAFAITRLRLRRVPRTEDWVMGAVAIFLLLYYTKFVARMDLVHLYQPYSIAFPLLLYIVYRAATAADATLRRTAPESLAVRLSLHPVSLLLVALAVAFTPGRIYNRLDRTPASYRPTIKEQPQIARLGFQDDVDVGMYRDLGRVIDAYLPPQDKLFDFTNEPALFFYVLNREPSTRWFDAALTLTTRTQEDQIRLLRRDPPKLIVFDSTAAIGLSNWDGISTAVRDYEVSRWILEHYRPLLTSHLHTFYIRRESPLASKRLHLEESPITDRVEFQTQRCNWGKLPSLLKGSGMPSADASSIEIDVAGKPGRLVLEPPSGERWSDFRWLELAAGPSGFAGSDLALHDRNGRSSPQRQIVFKTIGNSARSYVVPVSSCAQWYGYGRRPLRLDFDPAQDIAAVRLIR